MEHLFNPLIAKNLVIKNGKRNIFSHVYSAVVSGTWKNLFFAFLKTYRDFFEKIDIILILDKPLEFEFDFEV